MMWVNKMKTILFTLTLSVIFLTACAKREEPKNQVSNSDFCKVIDDLSRSIMTNRQVGIPMVESMQLANNIEDEQMRGLVQAVVNDAYAEPRFNTEKNQEKAITDFRNKMYHACINRTNAD